MLPSSLDVIVVNYNAGDTLRACVESILASQGVSVRCIIVDNASQDGSTDFCQQYAQDKLVLLRNTQNLGFSSAVNQGVALSSGAWLMLLNPDVIVPADSLHKLLTPGLLRHAPPALRVIAISSTSVRTKQHSPSKAERQMAQRLCQAEQELQQLCEENGHSLTILRPTMLYGLGRDATIGRMQGFIRRWHFLPIPATATGMRQPVHVDDIAAAVLQVLDEPRCIAKVYDLGGAQRFTVQQLAQRIFLDNNLPVRIISIPAGVLYVLLRVMVHIRPQLDWSPALLKRAMQDQVADNQPAIDDFQYAPRVFDGSFYNPVKHS